MLGSLQVADQIYLVIPVQPLKLQCFDGVNYIAAFTRK